MPGSVPSPPEPSFYDSVYAFLSSESMPSFLQPLLDYEIFGIEALRLVVVLIILLAAVVATTIVRYVLSQRIGRLDDSIKQKAAEGEDTWKDMRKKMLFSSLNRPLCVAMWGVTIMLAGVVLSSILFDLGARVAEGMFSIAIAWFVYNIVDIVEHYLNHYARKTDTKLDDMLVPAVRKTLRVLVVFVAVIQVYQAFSNQELTTILTGLGIGGLAFALAAQDTLKNLFGFAMILVDRPFQPGDRIVLDDHDGVIESVGFRSTRLRRLDGHMVVVPNSCLADRAIHNVAHRPFIKRVMNIGLTYDTPLEKMEEALAIVKDILKDHEGMHADFPPRIFFTEFNADNLNIMAIYWYHPPEYWDYMAFSEKVNLTLMRRFAEAGIEFAFPTQTIYLAGDPARDLVLKHEHLFPPELVPSRPTPPQ